MRLQQQRENAQEGSTTPHRATDFSAQTDPETAAVTAASSGRLDQKITFQLINLITINEFSNPVEQQCKSDFHLCVSAPLSLMELRQNVGRLLVTFVPALDLGQVNFECNVIDEILEQVLSNVESATPAWLRDEASN